MIGPNHQSQRQVASEQPQKRKSRDGVGEDNIAKQKYKIEQ